MFHNALHGIWDSCFEKITYSIFLSRTTAPYILTIFYIDSSGEYGCINTENMTLMMTLTR